ncbi:hypothetical protein RD055328_03960 [Companilactobacillus sp. RD055328]|uniref:phosphatase PAP2 family protein n=1 Tax=Companilactobacillus sp. RD055328 TaxID=2916634 RepID=UPI001FC86339|nr:phosphatase PAP2 family protein [Companilactobacillus sp. RD055328]GKQ42473.1 hypothetical protein RD055328_03960 [Companilactobacillus sp. RD055328]
MTKKITAISGFLIFSLFASLIYFAPNSLNLFDTKITNIIYNSAPSITPIIKFITTIGNTLSITIITTIVVLALFFNKKFAPALFIAINVSAIATINHLIKQFIQRPRPSVLHLVDAGGYSFPSGHSASSMALFLGLIFVITMISKKKFTWLKIILFIMPLLIGFSRIYLGVHYFSDVLAGLSYSLTITIIIASLFTKRRPS